MSNYAHYWDFNTPFAYHYKIRGRLKRLQVKTHANYPRASLEGLPGDIKLEILKLVGDLPSLRRLRLASQEYYAVARAHARYLYLFYEEEIAVRKDNNDRLPRVPPFDGQRNLWTPEAESAIAHILHDWRINMGLRAERWTGPWYMPGKIGFRFGQREYITARLFVLTGEHFLREQVSSHLQVLRCRVCSRIQRARLEPGDLRLMKDLSPYGEKFNLSSSGEDGIEKVQAARCEAKGYGWTQVIRDMSDEDIYNLVQQRKAVALVEAACEKMPHLAVDTISMWRLAEERNDEGAMEGVTKLLESLQVSGLSIVLPGERAQGHVPLAGSDSDVNFHAKPCPRSVVESEFQSQSDTAYESETELDSQSEA